MLESGEDFLEINFFFFDFIGFAATVAASPVDVVKTRYMNSPKGQYTGAIDCAMRMAKQEGFTAFYKGFVFKFDYFFE